MSLSLHTLVICTFANVEAKALAEDAVVIDPHFRDTRRKTMLLIASGILRLMAAFPSIRGVRRADMARKMCGLALPFGRQPASSRLRNATTRPRSATPRSLV